MLGKVTNSIDQHGQTKLQKRCGTTPRADSIDKKVTKMVNDYLKTQPELLPQKMRVVGVVVGQHHELGNTNKKVLRMELRPYYDRRDT
mgnify:CR=1 FL=1